MCYGGCRKGGDGLRLLWLLVSKYSYLPVPKRWQALAAELPQALVLLPLWGLTAGLFNAAAAHWRLSADSRWLAVLLVFLSIFSSGALWLRDILSVASGLKPPPLPLNLAVNTDTPIPPTIAADKPLSLNRAALLTGCMYLLLQYGCFLGLLHFKFHVSVYILAAVNSRFIYLWGIYDFAALQPAYLHRSFVRREFIRSAWASFIIAAACVAMMPSYLPALLPALLSATLFYRRRISALGALDEAAYGAAAGWSEILLYLYPILFSARG